MQIAVRSTYAAGVALIGAGVIAVSPVSPPTTTSLHLPAVQSSAVQLAAAANPITQWEQIVTEALQNTKTLVTGVFADPAPVLGRIVKNELSNFGTLGGALRDFATAFVGQLGDVPAGLRTGLSQVFTGHISDGFQTLFQTVLTPILVPIISLPNFLTDVQGFFVKPVQNLANAITAAVTPAGGGMGWLLSAGLPVVSMLADSVAASGDSLQSVYNALKAGKLGAAIGAILAIPGTITGALLNGYNDDGGGLLGPNGLLQGFRNALKVIAAAIAPVVPAPAAASKSAGSPTATPVAALATPGAVTLKAPVAADAGDDSAVAVAPVTKRDRGARGSRVKSSGEDGAASVASVASDGAAAKGSVSGAGVHKAGSSSKRDHTRARKSAGSAAADSGSSARGGGHARGAGAGTHRTAKAGGA